MTRIRSGPQRVDPRGPGRPTARTRAALVSLAGLAATALLVAGCSNDDTATSTTTTLAPGTTRPTLPAPGGNDQPLPVAWVTQVGGAGADSLAGAAGRKDAVVGVGTTVGIATPARSGSDALAVTVDAGDGTLRTTTQLGADGPVSASSVASAGTTGLTIACGSTKGSFGPSNVGGTDAWCGTISPTGAIEAPTQSGGDAEDRLDGVAVTNDGDHGYAAGSTTSLFPGAQDPTAGFLGGDDALVLRVDPSARPQWARQFGSAGDDRAEAVAVADDGDAIVAGTTGGSAGSTSLGGTDGWISRMDQSGAQRWLTQFGSNAADRVDAVAVGGDPRRGTELFVAGGSTEGTAGGPAVGGTDALVAAFDASGKQAWLTQFGSTGADRVTGVAVDGSTVYVAGTAAAPIVGAERVPLTPTPPAGNPSTPSTSGPTTTSSTTAPTTTGAPAPTVGPEASGRDGFLVALDAGSGEVRWTATFGSAGNDDVTGMTRTETGLLVLSGTTDGQVGSTAPAGGTDGFLLAFRLPDGGGAAASAV